MKLWFVFPFHMSFSVFSFVPFLLDSALKLILFCPWNWIVLRHWYIPSYLISQDHKSWKEPTRLFESMVVVGLHPNCDIQALQRQYFLRKSEGPGKLRSALGYQNQSRVEAEPNLEPQVFIIGCTDWITTTIVIIILTASCPRQLFIFIIFFFPSFFFFPYLRYFPFPLFFFFSYLSFVKGISTKTHNSRRTKQIHM